MSDTPRTDFGVFWAYDSDYQQDQEVVLADLARDLERELNAAKKELSILLPNIQKLMEDLANAEATINNMKSAAMEQTAAAVIIGEPK